MKFIEAKKAQVFVAHVQMHLNLKESSMGPPERRIPTGKVGCKICNLSVDRIYFQYKRKIGWAWHLGQRFEGHSKP